MSVTEPISLKQNLFSDIIPYNAFLVRIKTSFVWTRSTEDKTDWIKKLLIKVLDSEVKKFTLKSAALDGCGLFIEEANVGELEKWFRGV